MNCKREAQDPNDRTLGPRLPEEGETRLTFSLTNEGKFPSPRTCWCHQTAASLHYLYFITDGDEGTLALCGHSGSSAGGS